MTPISPELRAFLADWLAWVERGAPEGEPFSRRDGLCVAALDFGTLTIYREIKALFRDSGMDLLCPFGQYTYAAAERAATQHLDPNRLAWVRAKLAEGGEA